MVIGYTHNELIEHIKNVDALYMVEYCIEALVNDTERHLDDRIVYGLDYTDLLGALMAAERELIGYRYGSI